MEATAIDDGGRIMGWAVNPHGRNNAFQLTPMPQGQ
jgi:hypothetical protein